MKKLFKRICAWALIALSIALAGCDGNFWKIRRMAYISPTATPAAAATMPAAAAENSAAPAASPAPAAEHGDLPFSAVAYAAPDLEALGAAIEALARDIESGAHDEARLIDRYAEILGLYNEADSACQLAYLLYAMDVTQESYREEYARIDAALLELDIDMTELSMALLDRSGEAKEQFRARFGSGFENAVYAGEDLNSEDVVELLIADNELQMDYDELLTTFSFLDNGKEWTLDAILGDDSLDYETYFALYERYCTALNREAGGLFIELMALRSETASRLGYGSYAAYRYDCYGRDYSITDAAKFQQAVKDYIVPVFVAANARSDAVYDLYYEEYDEAAFIDSFRRVTAGNRYVGDALNDMLGRKLYDFSVSDRKMESSFTTYLSAWRMPFIFTQWEGDYGSIATVLHEFGHFMNYWYNPAAGWCSGDSLDLAEVDSQGFVFLMAPHYDALYGEGFGDLALTDHLLDALYAIVTGAMEDEFQQRVYADPGMTLEEMNALYGSLAAAYGMDEVYGFQGTEWVLIPHTFQSPMYYISYAVSMVAALELHEKLAESEDAAWTPYLGVLMRAPYAEFRDTLADNGLSDPLSAATVKRIAAMIDGSIS